MRHCWKVLGNEQIDFAMSGRSSALIELWSRMYEEKSPWLHEIDNANIRPTVAGRGCQTYDSGITEQG